MRMAGWRPTRRWIEYRVVEYFICPKAVCGIFSLVRAFGLSGAGENWLCQTTTTIMYRIRDDARALDAIFAESKSIVDDIGVVWHGL